jgi:hypothetical protein
MSVDGDIWSDNGFANITSMDTAHSVIFNAVEMSGVRSGRILDLGAGDGRLLARITELWPGLQPFAVEADVGRLTRGKLRHPWISFSLERVEDCTENEIRPNDEPWDLVLLMPGRLDEIPKEKAEEVVRVLRRTARHLIIYSYAGSLLEAARRHSLMLGVNPLVPIDRIAAVHGRHRTVFSAGQYQATIAW